MKRASAGFTLLEVLVAFVVLALTLSVIMRIFSGGLRNVSVADEYSQALLLAQSRLAELSVQPLEGEDSGEFDKKFRWRSAIRPWSDPALAAKPMTQPLPVRLLEIQVKVAWGEAGGGSREVALSTLRLAAVQGPGS